MDTTEIIDEVKKRLQETESNWDGCGSKAPSNSCIQKVVGVLKPLIESKFIPNSIGPSFSGGCTIIYSKPLNQELVIEISNDGNGNLIFIDGWDVSTFDLDEIDNLTSLVKFFLKK